ncbi:MAG: hypothetical protein AAF907_00870 [Planctomycetota bacterium]
MRRFPLLLPAALLSGLLAFAPAAFAQDDEAATGPTVETVEATNADVGDAEAGDAEEDAGPKTGPKLDFVPPPAKPKSFTTVIPLLSQPEIDALQKELERNRYRDVLEAGPSNAGNREIIETWAKWRVAQWTGYAPLPKPEKKKKDKDEKGDEEEDEPPPEPVLMVNDRLALSDAVSDLIREVNNGVGPRRGGRNAEAIKMQVFPILVAELLKLKDNHLVLRTQAIKTLMRLEVAGDGGPNTPFKRFGPAIGPLFEFYQAPGETVPDLAVKYQAAQAIAFIAENGRNVPGSVELQIFKQFGADLEAHPEWPNWMQGGLAAAISRMGLSDGGVARSLFAVVQDESRRDESGPFYEARVRAAAALVRIPGVPAQVKADLPRALEDLGRAMAKDYNEKPDAEFVETFRLLEFCFKPIAASEAAGLPGSAILTGTEVPASLKAAHQRMHPLVKHVCNQDLTKPASQWTPIPAADLTNAGIGGSE